MPHRGLSRPQRHPAPAQERAEGRSQGVHVERAAPLVALRDARAGGRLTTLLARQVVLRSHRQADRRTFNDPRGSPSAQGTIFLGDQPAKDFGPKKLTKLQTIVIGWSRRFINKATTVQSRGWISLT